MRIELDKKNLQCMNTIYDTFARHKSGGVYDGLGQQISNFLHMRNHYPVQKYRTRIAVMHYKFFSQGKKILITNFISHADDICNAFLRVRYFCN